MRPKRFLVSSLSCAPFALLGAAVACGSIPNDRPDGRLVPPGGILKGTVVYNGPHPCSADGHVVGAAVLLVFDRRNPPPPGGLASTPVNFGVVPGDVLFASEPRNPSSTVYCPQDQGVTETITVSAPYTISPLAGGQYVVQAFYDYTGDFLPTFKFRNLPEKGDVGGGNIDTTDALKPINAGNPNYTPKFLPVDIGTPQALPAGTDAGIPNFTIPETGAVTDNVTVTLGATLQSRRPYFYAGGLSLSMDPSTGDLTSTETTTSASPAPAKKGVDPNFEPILKIPQDIEVLASPIQGMDPGNVNNFESKLPHLLLHGGLPKAEVPVATGAPFKFQLAPAAEAGFPVWQNAILDPASQKWIPQDIPEGGGMPQLWPLVVLTKLIDDPTHTLDPESVTGQGSPSAPVVIMQGITLLGGDGTDATKSDSIYNSGIAEAFGTLFDTSAGLPAVFTQDHLTVAMRPAAICFDTLFDPLNPDKHGTIVTPHLFAQSADLTGSQASQPIVPPSALMNPSLTAIVKPVPVQGCLPVGRYAINIVYPDGQAWTVPNESGACAAAEGATDYTAMSCTVQPRPIVYSQGTRAVVEVTAATDPANCAGAMKVPAVCLPH